MGIVVGNTVASTAQSAVSSTTLALNNNKTDVLVAIGYRHSSSIVPTVTYGGVAMVSKISKVTSAGSVLRSEIFYLAAAPTGSNNIVVTWNGTISDVAAVFGIALFSVDSTITDTTASGGQAPGSSSPRSTSITTGILDALIVDVISDRSAGLTVVAGQTQVGKVGSGDNIACSYKVATTPTSYTMQWTPTETIEDWSQSVLSLKPARPIPQRLTNVNQSIHRANSY